MAADQTPLVKGALAVEDSALYQRCTRRERGLIAAEWGVTENNRRAHYYELTGAGRAHLRAETARWVRYAETVTDIPDDARAACAGSSRRRRERA